MCEGDIATTLQILVQLIVTLGAQVVYYDFVIQADCENLEIPSNPALVFLLLSTVIIQTTFVYYPSVSKHYLSDRRELEKRYPKIAGLIEKEKQSYQENGWLYPFSKEKLTLALFFLESLFAGYLGYGIADYFFEDTAKIVSATLLSPTIIALLSIPLYRAEYRRIVRHDLRVAEEKMIEAKPLPPLQPPPKRGATFFGTLFTVSSAASLNLSTIGAVSPSAPKMEIAATLAATAYRTCTYIGYNYKKVFETTAGVIASLPSLRSLTQYCGTFFNRSAKPPTTTEFSVIPTKGHA